VKNLPLFLTLMIGISLICGCASPVKDFDVVTNKVAPMDPNGLPLNPKWGQQAEHNTIPDPYVSCPASSYTLITDPFFVYNTADWTNSSKYPNCTSVPVTFNGGSTCGPHVNFENVTYEGTVSWDGHAFDDDYDLNVKRDDDSALYSASGHQVHIEFDSDETVDNWDDTHTWWDNFHHNAVDHMTYDPLTKTWVYDGKELASAMINGNQVIVIGELNMDSSHSAKTELHPVYAMFVHLPGGEPMPGGDPRWRSSWAFFVRNWGDEGFCSDGDQPLETREHKITVRIPDVAGLISDNVSEGAQNEDDLSPMQASMQPYGDAVLMTFTLLPPDKQSWFVGDLTFLARPPQNTTTAAIAAAPQSVRNPAVDTEPEERLDPDSQALEARIAKLPVDSQMELHRQLEKLIPRKKSLPVKVAVLFEPAKDEDAHPSLPVEVNPPRKPGGTGNKSTAELHRKKKIEFIKRYLAEREKKGK
jgi:hypothetical protein